MGKLVRCLLKGGPHDGAILDLPPAYCQERIQVAVNWVRQEPDGSISLFRGARPGGKAEWHLQHNAIYEKTAARAKHERAYVFLEMHEVARCTATTLTAGRQCLHAAEKGGLCLPHAAKAKYC